MRLKACGKRQRLRVGDLRSFSIVLREEGLNLASTENIFLWASLENSPKKYQTSRVHGHCYQLCSCAQPGR
jgi:hypothetical protein